MKRKVLTLHEVRKYLDEEGFEDPNYIWNTQNGICALVNVYNMGFCKDGKTKWYHFNLNINNKETKCVYFK